MKESIETSRLKQRVSMLRRVIFPLVMLSISGTCAAGGDFTLGKISAFELRNADYQFQFTQTVHGPLLVKECPTITVTVQYARVPWYSWLPLISSNHPSHAETQTALKSLQEAASAQRAIYFGAMGGGLRTSKAHCAFASKGLRQEVLSDKLVVLSFHDPV